MLAEEDEIEMSDQAAKEKLKLKPRIPSISAFPRHSNLQKNGFSIVTLRYPFPIECGGVHG